MNDTSVLYADMIERAGVTTLQEIGEKALLRDYLLPLCRTVCGDHGLGNDGGVMHIGPGSDVVITTDRIPTDLLPEQFGLMEPHDLGAYLVRVNVSDLAAMGSLPKAIVLTCAFPKATSLAYVIRMMYGAYSESARFSCPVVGGDTKASAERSLSATALGAVPHGRAVGRGPVDPGMRVYLSGPVGHAGAALRWFALPHSQRVALLGRSHCDELDDLLAGYIARPVPRIDLALTILERRCAAAMDITDGLVQTLTELSEYSNARIMFDPVKLRHEEAVLAVADALALNPVTLVQGIGLDLELVVIAATNPDPDQFYEIGEVLPGPANVAIPTGEVVVSHGFDHFSRDAIDYVSMPGRHPVS